MDILVFGLNHRTASLAVRERWAFTPEEARRALLAAQDLAGASENLILSTCNRTEIYSLLPQVAGFQDLHVAEEGNGQGPDHLLDFFHGLKNFRRERSAPGFYTLHREAAVEHLFRVAGGLDSMIVGEGQILRQLRDAFQLAQEAGSVGKVFQRLFPAALKAGKRARAETGISAGCLTHGQAALKVARERLSDLRGRRVLLIGSGKVTHQVTSSLKDLGVASIAVVNRTMENARRLAEEVDGQAYPLGDLPCLLEVADLVVSSTGSPQPLVRAEVVERVARRRGDRMLVIIDLAVPRDFDPACGEVPGVHLRNIDDLNEVVQASMAGRRQEVPRAESIIQEEIRAFFAQMNWIHLDPVIRHLVERFEAIRVGEVEKHIGAIPPEHRPVVEALTSALVKKILHFPIEKLKSLRDHDGLTPVEVNFLRQLFLTGIRPPHDRPAEDAPRPLPEPAPPDREPR